jgi:hypothetical protein
MQYTLSFRDIFIRYGKTITDWLRNNIEVGGKPDWIPFNPSTTVGIPTTVKGTAGRKKSYPISKSGSHHRMWVTGKTKNNAFKFTASEDLLRIYVDSKYEGIIEGNNTGGPFRRVNQVALFPMDATVSKFEQTQVIQDIKSEVSKTIEDYFQNILDVDISRTIKI